MQVLDDTPFYEAPQPGSRDRRIAASTLALPGEAWIARTMPTGHLEQSQQLLKEKAAIESSQANPCQG